MSGGKAGQNKARPSSSGVLREESGRADLDRDLVKNEAGNGSNWRMYGPTQRKYMEDASG